MDIGRIRHQHWNIGTDLQAQGFSECHPSKGKTGINTRPRRSLNNIRELCFMQLHQAFWHYLLDYLRLLWVTCHTVTTYCKFLALILSLSLCCVCGIEYLKLNALIHHYICVLKCHIFLLCRDPCYKTLLTCHSQKVE